MTLKRSPLGTPFFAHKARGPCSTAAETEEHLYLKKLAVMAARANGWTAETEAVGSTPSGEPWRADVLARKGSQKVAVEIQWSSQTDEETLQRQARYARSGVRGLWLLRQLGFLVARELPAVCIGGSLMERFLALIPEHSGTMRVRDRDHPERWKQALPMSELLDAAFSKRLRFGVPREMDATVTVKGVEARCWRPLCGAQMHLVTAVEIALDQRTFNLSVQSFVSHPNLLRSVLSELPAYLGVGCIKFRST